MQEENFFRELTLVDLEGKTKMERTEEDNRYKKNIKIPSELKIQTAYAVRRPLEGQSNLTVVLRQFIVSALGLCDYSDAKHRIMMSWLYSSSLEHILYATNYYKPVYLYSMEIYFLQDILVDIFRKDGQR